MFYIYDKSSGFLVQASVLENYQTETDNMFLSALVTDPNVLYWITSPFSTYLNGTKLKPK